MSPHATPWIDYAEYDRGLYLTPSYLPANMQLAAKCTLCGHRVRVHRNWLLRTIGRDVFMINVRYAPTVGTIASCVGSWCREMAYRDRKWMDLESYLNGQRATLGDLLQGIELGGHCSACERTAGVDRWELAGRLGKHRSVAELRPALRCMGCGNKGTNSWVFCMQAR